MQSLLRGGSFAVGVAAEGPRRFPSGTGRLLQGVRGSAVGQEATFAPAWNKGCQSAGGVVPVSLATSGKGYKSKADCQKVIDTIRKEAAKAKLDDQAK